MTGPNENNQDEYEARLQWRLKLLKIKLDEDKVVFAPEVKREIRASLDAIQTKPDGDFDLSTVNGRIRALALAVEAGKQREDAKKQASIQDISSAYFDFLEKQFGAFAKQAKENGFNIDEAAMAISHDDDQVKRCANALPELLDVLDGFWENVTHTTTYHLQDLSGTKGVYGGGLFPSPTQSIASTTGLYIDTIILPDPLHRSRPIFERVPDKQKTHFLFKNALNALQYRDLALANLDNPIVAINPYRSSVDQSEMSFLREASEQDGLKHAANIFGQQFHDIGDLQEFVFPLDTTKKLAEKIVSTEHALFDTNWSGDINAQIERAMTSEWADMGGASHPGEMILQQLCIGKMMQVTDVIFNSRYLLGTPLIEAPTVWQYLNWKYKYNCEIDPAYLTELHIIKGLQSVSEKEENWLGKIPHDALIEMRATGAFQEIRETLSAGVEDIANLKPDNFFRSSDQIVDNIRSAHEKHLNEIKKLKSKKVKFAGHDIGSMLIAGGLDISGFVTGLGTFGAASYAVNQFLDVPKLKQIPSRFREIKDAHIELKKSPMGLFFKHK